MNHEPGRRSSTRLLAGVAALAAIDLLTKLWGSRSLVDGGIELPGPVDLRLSHNSGIAFGSFGDLPAPVIILLTAAVSVGLVLAGLRGAVPAWPCAFIAGGALANVIDRIHGGSVVDLLHTGWWPTFNLADVFITVGAGMLVAGLARSPRPSDADADPSASVSTSVGGKKHKHQ